MADQTLAGAVLGLSILLQLLAASKALRLIPVSKGRAAWLLLSSALALMSMRRVLPFYGLVSGTASQPPDLSAELVALVISVLMVAAMFAIGPLFEERERSEQRLRAARKAWEDIFQAIGHPALVLDAEHRILEANRAAQQAFDLTAEAIGARFCDFAHGAGQTAQECPAARALTTGQVELAEIEMARVDGVFLVSCTPVRDEGGGPPKIIHIATDITQRRRLEQRLRQSEKLEAIGQLAGGIAHDFNNQLAGILGHAELLARRLADPPLRDHAQGVVRAAERAADLTRQLLAFARKGKYLSAPVDLHELIAEVVSLLSHSLDKRVVVRQNPHSRPATVLGDPSQLQSALLNLAINARDAMPDGGVLEFATDRVTLDADACRALPRDVEPGEYVRVRITDTGVGMDPETLRHIFEPFFTTKARGQGTGMGLASVYGTVEAHGGAVTAQSAPGRGTTITLYLPVAAIPASAALKASRPAAVTGTGRVLVVDDEPEVRGMLSESLRQLGYEVVTCADGVEAVERYRDEAARFDLVILDMIMPRMGGRQAFAALRRLDPEVRVLLCSGHSLDGEAQASLDEGALGFLQKPFRVAELSRQVATALGTAPPDAG